MNDRSLFYHLIAIVLIKMIVLMGIWYVFMKPYKVQPSAADVTRAVLGPQSTEGTPHGTH
ncbi:MAG TPA: hypothetical protein VF472_12620 [Burkholderiaceae bacterium]